MKLVRTIFAHFAIGVSLVLLIALFSVERPVANAAEVSAPADEVKRFERRLIVPVRGFARGDLSNTWGAARSEGRRHEGIDIMAPQGAPVLAAADGRVVRFWNSERGGVSIYQADEEGELIFYYAHLSARAGGLKEGDRVRRGEVIGYVGATGNATTPHLHFEIQQTEDARRWWQGRAVNPYPYLASGQAL
jgi:peptidoglycan LD-endopeptidase LytH